MGARSEIFTTERHGISRVNIGLDSILFNSRPLASGFALRATTRQVARSTDADYIRPTWPDIMAIALGANLKPSALFFLHYQSRSDGNFSPARLAGS